jgi:hypothetical protein
MSFLNLKIKKMLAHFFIETKIGMYVMASIAILNTIEGIVHLVVASIGVWGMVDTSTYDIRVWLPAIENFIFGIFSILTGYALGVKHEHHHGS